MFFGRLDGQWAYYDSCGHKYQSLSEAQAGGRWHGEDVTLLCFVIHKFISVVNLQVTREEIIDVFIPEGLLRHLI